MTALVFIALMAFSVVLAFMAKRGVIANSMDDVMVAGRSFGAFMVFFVTVGETYGIGTMIGVPGAIYSKGVSYSLWFLGYILLGFVVGYFMNPAIWRMGKISGAMTMPDCFRWRYGSKALEVLVAVICIVFLLPWMQMQFAGLATILRYIGWDISYTVGIGISAAIAYLYIAVAGIRAPAWISIMKDILMIAAIVSGGLVAIHNMPGGISGIFDMAIAHFPDKVVIDAEPITKNATFVFSTIIFQAFGFCVTPLQYQFIFTAKSEDTIRRNQIIMPLYMFMYPFLIVAAYFVLVTVPNLNDPDSSFMALAAANLPECGGGRRADLHPRHCNKRPQPGRDFQPQHLGRVPIFRVSEAGRPRNEYGYRGVSPDQRGIGGDAAQPDARSHQHRVLLGDPMFPDGAGNVLLARGHPDGRIRRPADGRGRRRRPHGNARDLLGPESGICRHDSERAGHGSGLPVHQPG